MGSDAVIKRIDERLAALGKKASRACHEAGLSRDAIRNIRRGRARNFNVDTLVKLAAVLECEPSYLLPSSEEDPESADDVAATHRRHSNWRANLSAAIAGSEMNSSQLSLKITGGRSKTYVANILSGRMHTPSIERFAEIADALKISITELYYGKPDARTEFCEQVFDEAQAAADWWAEQRGGHIDSAEYSKVLLTMFRYSCRNAGKQPTN